MNVIFTAAARNDLSKLYIYIAENANTERAYEYTEAIRSYCLGLAAFPQRGTMRNDLRPGLRIIGFRRRVTIAFHVSAERVVIDRILYGGRNVDALLTEED
jgi:toxin ParE1/3/4